MVHIKSLSVSVLPDFFWSEKMTLPLVQHYKSIVLQKTPSCKEKTI